MHLDFHFSFLFHLLQTENKMKLTFIGSASCFPTPTRGVSCTGLSLPNGETYLFDCGEGSQIQIQKSGVKMGKIRRIFITHLHGDHVFGLPGLLCTLGNGLDPKTAGEKEVDVFGPIGLYKYITVSLELSRSQLNYKLNVHEIMPDEDQYPSDWQNWPVNHETSGPLSMLINTHNKINKNHDNEGHRYWPVFQDQTISIKAVPIQHRIPCFGYVVIEADKVGTLDVEKLRKMGLPPGPDYGKLKNGEPVIVVGTGQEVKPSDVIGVGKKGRKIVILGDTSDTKEIEIFSQDADAVVHEATMEDSLRDKAIEFGHSTPSMAAQFAIKVNCQKLCLNHLSPRYKPLSDVEGGDISANIIKFEARKYLDENGGKNVILVVAEDLLENTI